MQCFEWNNGDRKTSSMLKQFVKDMYNITKFNKAICLINPRKENILICIPLLTEEKLSICLVLPRQTVTMFSSILVTQRIQQNYWFVFILIQIVKRFQPWQTILLHSFPYYVLRELKLFIRQLQYISLYLLLSMHSNKKISS